eukprot:362009-Chlamydomonas_euryale.AAC.2
MITVVTHDSPRSQQEGGNGAAVGTCGGCAEAGREGGVSAAAEPGDGRAGSRGERTDGIAAVPCNGCGFVASGEAPVAAKRAAARATAAPAPAIQGPALGPFVASRPRGGADSDDDDVVIVEPPVPQTKRARRETAAAANVAPAPAPSTPTATTTAATATVTEAPTATPAAAAATAATTTAVAAAAAGVHATIANAPSLSAPLSSRRPAPGSGATGADAATGSPSVSLAAAPASVAAVAATCGADGSVGGSGSVGGNDDSCPPAMCSCPFSLLCVRGLADRFNAGCLGASLGDLAVGPIDVAVVSNYMIDLCWLLREAPALGTARRLLVLHEARSPPEGAAPAGALLHAPRTLKYGTHHSKFLLLSYRPHRGPHGEHYPGGLRVVVTTANFIPRVSLVCLGKGFQGERGSRSARLRANATLVGQPPGCELILAWASWSERSSEAIW